MKNKKTGIAIAIIVFIALIILIYFLSKSNSTTLNGAGAGSILNNLPGNLTGAGFNGVFTSNPFQQVLTGANSTWQSLFNSNATSGAYNITPPTYINGGKTLTSNYGSSAPTLDLQYMPQGCAIDNYLAGNC